MSNDACPICESPASFARIQADLAVECRRCGKFSLTNGSRKRRSNLEPGQVANISGWIRENQGSLISERRLEELRQLRTPTVGEKADRLLLFLAARFPKPSEEFEVLPANHVSPETNAAVNVLSLFGVAWAQDFTELRFLLVDYLTREKGAVVPRSLTNELSRLVITPKGWSQVAALRRGDIKSDSGFVAMWFDKTMDAADLAIAAAIRAAGYRALRVDRLQHNNRIDDEILAAIRRSKFLVADFTGQRGGVYFEAGFALGLGIPVIWLCRSDALAQVHFDNRQYNFILWTDDKLDELERALKNRIEATIGQGPLATMPQA